MSSPEDVPLFPQDPPTFESSAIYGNIVVWTDRRNHNADIFGYNLSTQEEFQITTDSNDQTEPAIYGNIVVWTDRRNESGSCYGPGRIWSNCNADIFGYNLLTNQEFQITIDSREQAEPAIYGNIVVWTDWRNESGSCNDPEGIWGRCNADIYGYDLSTSREFRITKDEKTQSKPAIYGNIVVWEDRRNGKYNIYGYDLSPVPFETIFQNVIGFLRLFFSNIWNFLFEFRLLIGFVIYILDVLYNIRSYRKAKKKGLRLPRMKIILLILGSFPLFINFLGPKK